MINANYKQKTLCFCLVSLFSFISSKPLLAQISPSVNGVVFVNKSVAGGNQSGDSWANAVPELADALLSAHSNSSIQQIWVAQGTYNPKYSAGTDNVSPTLQFGTPYCGYFGSFVMVNNVKLYGGFQNANETSITQRDSINNNTILSGLDSFVHVVMSVGPVGSAELNGFTVKDGKSYPFQTLYVNGQPTRSAFGAGVYIQNTNISIKNCTITNNKANQGGGIYATTSTLRLINTKISNNTATALNGSISQGSSFAYGGGIYFYDGISLNIDSCEFNNNSAISEYNHSIGGGLNVSQTNYAPVTISNTSFENNKALLNLPSGATPGVVLLFGGGLSLNNPNQLSYINNCVFNNNKVQLSAQNATLSTISHNHVMGAGIYNNSPLVINNSEIKNNELIANINTSNNAMGLTSGAGLATDGARNGVVGGVQSGVNLTINNCIIENNVVSGNFNPSGGGISYLMRLHLLATAIKPTINNSIIRNNTAKNGGGIHCFTLAPIIKNSLLVGNSATNGSVIFNESEGQSAQPQLINCTVYGNKSVSNQPLISNNNTSNTSIHNSIIFNNSGELSTSSNTITYSIVEGTSVFPGIGNKNQAPLWTSVSTGDFSLQPTSPAINAGSNAAYAAIGNLSNDTDLIGNGRIAYNTIDMGAFEQHGKVDTSTAIRNLSGLSSKMKLFPNPALAGQAINLHLDWNAETIKGASLTITDGLGRVWQKINILQKEQMLKMPTNTGVYFLTLTLSNGEKTTALVVID